MEMTNPNDNELFLYIEYIENFHLANISDDRQLWENWAR